jgi:hypothetical protein
VLRIRTRVLPALGATLAAALILPTSVGAAARPAVADPVADYQFQNDRTSTDPGAPDLTDIKGGNTFATDTVDGTSHTVLTFARNHGLTLTPTNGIIASNEYSIVLLVRLDRVDGFRRLVDFKHGTSDSGLYDNSGRLEFFDLIGGKKVPIPAGQYVQIVITRSAARRTTVGYVDGIQQFSFRDKTKAGVIDAKSTLRFFADDKVVSGEDSAGAVARIRIYAGALSAADVASLDREPAG